LLSIIRSKRKAKVTKVTMEAPTKKRLPIGTTVRINGGGNLLGLIVDYYDRDDFYVIGFPGGLEFIFPSRVLRIVEEFS